MSFDQLFAKEKAKEASFYDVLGCDRSSSAEQITAEYRSKVRLLHPDKTLSDEGHDQFTEFQAAYSVLNDSKRRMLYDSWLSSPLSMDFESFERNSDSIRQSMHWVTPKSTLMIVPDEPKTKECVSRWGDRYKSEIAEKFRSYQI